MNTHFSWKQNNTVDYRITTQLVANKTEAKQQTFAECLGKFWKSPLQLGCSFLYACFIMCACTLFRLNLTWDTLHMYFCEMYTSTSKIIQVYHHCHLPSNSVGCQGLHSGSFFVRKHFKGWPNLHKCTEGKGKNCIWNIMW
jgi:hypothetical protein